jgi:hypothetical protein
VSEPSAYTLSTWSSANSWWMTCARRQGRDTACASLMDKTYDDGLRSACVAICTKWLGYKNQHKRHLFPSPLGHLEKEPVYTNGFMLCTAHSSIYSSTSVMKHPETYRTRLLGAAPDTTCEARLISSGEVRLYEAFLFSELRDGSVKSC